MLGVIFRPVHLIVLPRDVYDYNCHFTDEETEADKHLVTCPRWHSYKTTDQDPTLLSLTLEPAFK